MAKVMLTINEPGADPEHVETGVTMEYRWVEGRRRLTIKLDEGVFVPRARGVVGGTGVDQVVVDFGVGAIDFGGGDRPTIQYTFETTGRDVIYDRTR